MTKLNSRTRARRLALQGLYEWQMSDNRIRDIEAHFLIEKATKNVDLPLFRELLINVAGQADELDGYIAEFLDRPVEEIDPVELAVMRLGAYELAKRPQVPYRVVINEAVELAKTFGAEAGHKYVNGVMDKLAARLRQPEVAAHSKGRS